MPGTWHAEILPSFSSPTVQSCPTFSSQYLKHRPNKSCKIICEYNESLYPASRGAIGDVLVISS